ncbi:MAG: cytochrome C [Deltaproteobacteria bacterium]|nr:cytochrome C [Deltaproteobacteria bacterium]
MNKFKVLLVTIIVLLSTPLLSGVTCAFHEGGEGYCEGCHTILGSPENQDWSTDESSDGPSTTLILKGSDPSSTCLRCHAESGADHSVLSNDGSRFTPGGDFYWLQKTFSWTVEGLSYLSRGDSHGHNIVALDYGLNPDERLSQAPGGSYPSAALGCTSCHDPHAKTNGNVGNPVTTSVPSSYGEEPSTGTPPGTFRLLGGVGYAGGQLRSGVTFRSPAPIAEASPFGWAETDSNHTAYGSGMSEWCANCHGGFLSSRMGGAAAKHPAGNGAKIPAEISNNYNSYEGTGHVGGGQASAYLALVPFEVDATSTSLLDPSSSSGTGAAGNANVMCLTCHRAHASAFPNVGRWDFKATFMADSHPKAGDGGASGSDVLHSYYGRDMISEFGKSQRQLCSKCHRKD